MIDPEVFRKQLPFVLDKTDFSKYGERYEGKVRDTYRANGKRLLVTTDRLSCFDVVVTSVPFKGLVLTQLAAYWFKQTEKIIANHIISIPDPNVMLVRDCQIVPIEVVVRGYLAGSAWRDYEAGQPVSGIKLPAGLKQYDKLPSVMLTPSTKAPRGEHDEPISEVEILKRNIISPEKWEKIRTVALKLFECGSHMAEQRGLLLADTKYELGFIGDELILADEIHTLDSSRFWVASSYRERIASGQTPEMLDKQPTREWLLSQGYRGNGPIPDFSVEHRVALAQHYVSCFERITGQSLQLNVGPVTERIAAALARL